MKSKKPLSLFLSLWDDDGGGEPIDLSPIWIYLNVELFAYHVFNSSHIHIHLLKKGKAIDQGMDNNSELIQFCLNKGQIVNKYAFRHKQKRRGQRVDKY